MKILDTTPITDTVRFPIKKGTLKFIQDAHKETVANLLIGLIGSTYNALTCYVLYGCVNSGSGLVYNISDGYIFYLGELFPVASAAFTSPGGEVAVLNITTTQYTTDADPVTFSDASTKNVHNIRAITIASAVSGTGIADYSAVSFFSLQGQINTINEAWTSRSNVADVVATGGSGVTITACSIKYKITGKTMHVAFRFTSSNTTRPSYYEILIPASKQNATGLDVPVTGVLSTAADGIIPDVNNPSKFVSSGSPTKIVVYQSSGTNASNVTCNGFATFEMA